MNAPADCGDVGDLEAPPLPASLSASMPAAVELWASPADRDSVRTRTSARLSSGFGSGGLGGFWERFMTLSRRSAVWQLGRPAVRAQTDT